ncbi:MAG: inositol monophosphatase [Ardenticatenaceae bacterium]|nr:inositol monophosphatase [Ardenticatenaceae bacterium]HBY96808.1 hypothetical protein [Chloroflexota bacterium]
MSPVDETRLLETAMRAARAGGQLALARLGAPGYQKWKGPRDLVTGAVLDIQERIVEVIRQDFPDHHCLAEEGQALQEQDADPLWIIDPVDGSLNFFQGIPSFSICVGYREAGIYRVGVVYDPCRDELFHAVFGRGAYLNDRRIHAALYAEGQDVVNVDGAMIGTDWPGSVGERKVALLLARILGNEALHLWVLGSPALGLCYVATGRLHAYYHLQLNLWDVAAAAVILGEAGGLLADITGGSWLHSEGGYLGTSSDLVHDAMLEIIKPILRHQGVFPASLAGVHG